MAFTDEQTRQLTAKLDSRHVKTRAGNGHPLHYLEGWHVMAEANRIFGFDGWDRRTLTARCVWTGMRGKLYATAYISRVRIRVRAGDTTIVREGSGSGDGKALTPGEAHEMALKSAETDATKRALATFGNAFGLALYDPKQIGVSTPKELLCAAAEGPWVLNSATGEQIATLTEPEKFLEALRRTMSSAKNIEALFGVWEQNLNTVRILNYALKQKQGQKSDLGERLMAHLKGCAVAIVNPPSGAESGGRDPDMAVGTAREPRRRTKIDKSVLTHGEIKRRRSKEHLRFVAKQPCLVCGRAPSHAHHIRYAQARGLGLKVSDEFAVPLCAIHHTENHATGDERRWWEARKVDPLPEAKRLWQQSLRIGRG